MTPEVRIDILAKPGSQSALRRRNLNRILDALRASGPATQAELSRQTGLSSATISNLVRVLVADGSVETERTTSSGRRALTVRLLDAGSYAIGIDFGRRHLRIVIATTGYTVVAEYLTELEPGYQAIEGVTLAVGIVNRLLEEHGIPPHAVLGAGVGIPGPIDRRSGTVVHGMILPEWVGIDLATLEEHVHFPTHFENDANLGALAEISWGLHSSVSDLVFIKIASGIGSGLVLNGALHHGNLGVTGEIGHATINEHGSVCHCGNRGCLESVASTSVMIELLSRSSTTPVSTSDIVRKALSRDPATLRVLDDAGMAVGRSLAVIANLVNPEVIVVGGPLASLGELLLRSIRRGFVRHALPVVAESTSIVMTSLGDRAEALGAASLVLQRAARASSLP